MEKPISNNQFSTGNKSVKALLNVWQLQFLSWLHYQMPRVQTGFEKRYSDSSRCYDDEKQEKKPNDNTETYDDGWLFWEETWTFWHWSWTWYCCPTMFRTKHGCSHLIPAEYCTDEADQIPVAANNKIWQGIGALHPGLRQKNVHKTRSCITIISHLPYSKNFYSNRWCRSHMEDMEEVMETFECLVCGYIYNPEEGDPSGGIPPGVTFFSLPDDWLCPECSAGKNEFAIVELWQGRKGICSADSLGSDCSRFSLCADLVLFLFEHNQKSLLVSIAYSENTKKYHILIDYVVRYVICLKCLMASSVTLHC